MSSRFSMRWWRDALFSFVLYYCVVLPVTLLRDVTARYTTGVSRRRQEKRYVDVMQATDDYNTWAQTAAALDRIRGYSAWCTQRVPDRSYVNQRGIERETYLIAALLATGDSDAIGRYLRTGLARDIFGVCEPPLYRYYCGTKGFVDDYTRAVGDMVQVYASGSEARDPDFAVDEEKERLLPPHQLALLLSARSAGPRQAAAALAPEMAAERYTMLKHTAQSYGRSALLLSGGASLGMYHTGVVRALWLAGIMPRILCGSSAGSIVASIFCTRTDEEIHRMATEGNLFDGISLDAFETHTTAEESVRVKVNRLLSTGAFMDLETLMRCLQQNCGQMTFADAYARTGRILNVSVAAHEREGDKSMLLNYLTAPTVLIWSAVAASCAMPGLFSAVQLMQRDAGGKCRPYLEGQLWFDGSVPCDLPKQRLAQLYDVNFFIVSQTNPHVVPFLPKPPSQLVHKQSRITRRLWFWLCGELKHWLVKLYRFRLIPRHDGWEVPYLMCTQSYHGDVTIRPIGSVWRAIPDFINLTTNPSPEHLEYVQACAQRQTWPHVHQIRTATDVERILDECLGRLKRQCHQCGECAVDGTSCSLSPVDPPPVGPGRGPGRGLPK